MNNRWTDNLGILSDKATTKNPPLTDEEKKKKERIDEAKERVNSQDEFDKTDHELGW